MWWGGRGLAGLGVHHKAGSKGSVARSSDAEGLAIVIITQVFKGRVTQLSEDVTEQYELFIELYFRVFLCREGL